MEYRLVSRRKPQMLWKRFLFGNPEEYLDGPKEEEVDLFAQFGWEYLSKCGNFFVYQAEGEQVFRRWLSIYGGPVSGVSRSGNRMACQGNCEGTEAGGGADGPKVWGQL